MHQLRGIGKATGEVASAFSLRTQMSACTGARAHPLRSALTKPRRLVGSSHHGVRRQGSAALLPCSAVLLARRLGGAALGKGRILHAVTASVRTGQRPRGCRARRPCKYDGCALMLANKAELLRRTRATAIWTRSANASLLGRSSSSWSSSTCGPGQRDVDDGPAPADWVRWGTLPCCARMSVCARVAAPRRDHLAHHILRRPPVGALGVAHRCRSCTWHASCATHLRRWIAPCPAL